MKVAVTGASGFIGSALLPLLNEHDVTVLGRQPVKGARCHTVDLNDAASVSCALQNIQPDALIHLAWQGIPDFSAQMCEVNRRQHDTLFAAIAQTQCERIIITGTCMEYRGLQGEVTEAQTGDDLDLFAQTKLAIWQKAQAILAERTLFWARPFYVYGPGQREGSLIPSLLNQVAQGQQPQVNNPDAAQDFVHVDDVVRGLAAMLDTNAAPGVFNLGCGHLTRIQQIALWLFAAWQGDALSPLTPCSSGMYASLAKVTAELGWQPHISMQQGIEDWVAHVKGA